MSALHLKQKIYQQSSSDSVKLLSRYYSLKCQSFSVSTTQKAYKCFECCILVNDQKHCAGFGRNEEEAILNAGRIALESIIDSGDQQGLSRAMEPEDPELEKFISRLAIEDFEVLRKEKLSVETLSKMSLETLRNFFNVQEARKVFDHFHPSGPSESAEIKQVKAMNEKLQGLLSLKSPPKYLLCPISQEILEDPVSTADGHTFEKKNIEAWLQNHSTSPVTGLPLSDKSLRPNFAIKMAVQAYREVLDVLNLRPSPALNTNTVKDLFKTVYGHQFGVPFADVTSERLNQMRTKAEIAVESGNFNIKYY